MKTGRRFTEAELRLGADPIWILDLTLGGVVYRFATETVSIKDGSDSLLYHGTLSNVDYASSLEFVSPDFEMPSAAVAVTFREDIAKRIAQGVDLGSATAQLALWIDGNDYDDRQVLIEGRVDVPSYGAVGEPVTFSIEADWLRNSRSIPNATQVIDDLVFDDADDNAEGNTYPIIIGAPGRQTFSGSPIYIVDDGTSSGTVLGLVAGHACTAATVQVLRVQTNGTSTAYSPKTLYTAQDSNGNTYTYVAMTGQYTEGDTFFAMFNEGGGGLLNPYSVGIDSDGNNTPTYLTGGGDLVRYLLHQTGAKIDDGRCVAAAPFLNSIQFEGFIGERVDVMSFLQDEILPLLPCSLRASSEGIYPVVWRYDATTKDAVAKLTADREIFRDGLVDFESNEIANEISIKYRHNVRYNRLKKAVTVTGDLHKRTSGFLWRTDYAVASMSRYGLRSMELETEMITSRASAGRVVNWMSRAYCGRHRTIKYSAPQRLGWLEVGDVIALTDSELHLSDQVAIVQSIEWGETDLLFTFLIVADLPRDTIPTG